MNRQPTGPCQIHQDNARQIPRAAFHLLPATWLATMSVRKATNLDETRRSAVLPRNFARLRIERRIQRQRAVAEGLEAVPLGATRRQRQHRTLAIKRLDRRFLVYATHRRLFLRIQVQINIHRRPLSCCMPRRICAQPPPLPLNKMLRLCLSMTSRKRSLATATQVVAPGTAFMEREMRLRGMSTSNTVTLTCWLT